MSGSQKRGAMGGEGSAAKKARATEDWHVPASAMSKRFVNPIRAIVDQMKLDPIHTEEELPMIRLSIGDPTVFGNYPPPEEAGAAVIEAIQKASKNGYAPSHGYAEARKAIAGQYTSAGSPLTENDVVIASGCSGALDLAIGALADEGTNILLPAPGFSLYKTLASARAVETRSYQCLAEKGWEIDLAHLESLIDGDTRAVVITNPSNPCGSNFTRKHVEEIVAVCEKHKLPIIADEIYADMVFPGQTFTSVSSIKSKVPVLACGGLAKRWLVPGWRCGWVLIRDQEGVLAKEIRGALINLSMLILGANTLVQAAIPGILANTPQTFYDKVMGDLHTSAKLCFDKLSAVPGLSPVMPQGAMYLMVGVDVKAFKDVPSDRAFCEMLVTEQSVFCLPGAVFDAPNYFRIVTTVPGDNMAIAMDRITKFCKDHHC